MFGDLMGNMQQKQEEMLANLKKIEITESLEGIVITGNATKEVTNVSIDDKYLDKENKEELEDILVVAINNFVLQAINEEGKASQDLLSDLLPPGMEGLFGG